jgi:prepilin-type N-terminal cleavage/methylation domain-containing protein
MIKKSKGFTLIELLVVIAIIGILSSVVLASLNSARAKGGNAAVKANLSGIRSQAEIVYDDDGQDYSNVCDNQGVIDAVQAAITAGGDTGAVADRCNASATEWAANALLKTAEGSNTYWCVDSAGKSKGESAELSAATACA